MSRAGETATLADRAGAVFLAHAPLGAIRAAAALAARPRPLEPCPGWRFAIDEEGAAALGRFRLAAWEHFLERGVERPVRVRWRVGLRLDLHLGNDLSRALFVGGRFEPNELSFLATLLRPGMVFVDGGANEGLYTVLAARRVEDSGLVVAIEPSEREHDRLLANVRLNRLENVRSFRLALSDHPGESTLAIAEPQHAGQNAIGTVVANPKVRTVAVAPVELETLDRLCAREGLERLDVVKLDLEGGELRALRGARETLARFRPVVQLELEEQALARQGASQADLLELLDEAGYRLHVFDRTTGRPRPRATEDELEGNVIAAPREWEPSA